MSPGNPVTAEKINNPGINFASEHEFFHCSLVLREAGHPLIGTGYAALTK